MINVIIYLGTLQGVILSLILLTTRRGNIGANRILGTKVLLFTFVIFSFLFRPGELTNICFLCIVIQNVFLIIALIYLYTVALTGSEAGIGPGHIRCFIPLFLSIASYLIYYYLIFNRDASHEHRLSLLGSFSQAMTYWVIVVMMSS